MKVRKHDIVLFLQKSKNKEEWRSAIVTEVHPDGTFNITGHHVPGYLETGSGRCDPAQIGQHPYGFYCDMKIIGHCSRIHYMEAPSHAGEREVFQSGFGEY